MHLFDTHTHLNDATLFPDRKKHLTAFVDQGGKGLVNVGVDEQRNKKAIEIAREAKSTGENYRVKATIGYHPSEVCFGKITRENITMKMDALQALYEKNKEHIVAIGECGIDTHYPDGAENIELQKELFHRQCQLAKDLGLPVVIHSRDDFDSTREVVKNFVDQKIYFHCYGYGKDEISILQEACHQLRVGFCGNVTYPKAQPLRDALLACDLENIVFETDAPYLAPQVLRGKTNEPANVRYIYEYVAELLQMNLPTLAEKIEKNVKRLYSL